MDIEKFPTLEVYHGDNLKLLKEFHDKKFDLIYIDPPFGTGKIQRSRRIKTVNDNNDFDRIGFGNKKYKSFVISDYSFDDTLDDFASFIWPRISESHRLLNDGGSFFFHIDYREAHYVKIIIDLVFGRSCFMNEIIWSYDFGARSKKKWPTKHDTIFWYVKDPKNYTFNFDAMDRIPYMAPGLVGPDKAAKGKTPTDVWWHTIVPTNGKERTGYPTQKPRGIIDRIIKVHSNPGDTILDFFAGSGTVGESAYENLRSSVLIDSSNDAIDVMRNRFRNVNCIFK